MISLQDLIDKVDQLKVEVDEAVSRLRFTAQNLSITTLADLSHNLGLVTAGEFRSGNALEPGSGFSGVRIGFPGFEYSGLTWHIVGVNNDTLQVGISATDGKLYAGDLLIDSSGMSILAVSSYVAEGPNNINWYDSLGGTVKVNMVDIYTPAGGTPATNIFNIEAIGDVAGSSEVVGINIKIIDSGGPTTLTHMAFSDTYGIETYAGTFTVNQDGGDYDFIVEGDTDTDLIHVDASTDRVGISTATPSVLFDVQGESSLDGAVTINESGADVDFRLEGTTATNLIFGDAGNNRVGIKTNSPASTLDVSGGLTIDHTDQTGNVYYGTWSPSVSNTTNIDAVDQLLGYYIRIGNWVTCIGRMRVDPTVAGAVSFDMSLPIATTFANNYQAGGVFSRLDGDVYYYGGGAVKANSSTNKADFDGGCNWVNAVYCSFHFSYIII